MTDELTPEEREALRNLPRERMPSAGLEDRVVGAMRERGIVKAKRPGRVVRITNSRVAGLIAACVVLIAGAYAIGLHRGSDNDLIRSVVPVLDDSALEIEGLARTEPARPSAGRLQEPETPATPSAPVESKQAIGGEPRQESREKARTVEENLDAGAPSKGDAHKDEPVVADGLSARRVDEDAAAPSAKRANQPPAPAANMFAQESVAPSTVLQRTFNLGGTPFIVESPDSVRIVEDPDGRTLLIYTSDGLIRIRLAN